MLSIRFTPERTAIRPSPYRNHRFISIRRPGVSVKSIYYFKSKYSNKIIIPIIFDNFFCCRHRAPSGLCRETANASYWLTKR